MPWKECSVMDERLQFVARRLAGEAMAELCREFGLLWETTSVITCPATTNPPRTPPRISPKLCAPT